MQLWCKVLSLKSICHSTKACNSLLWLSNTACAVYARCGRMRHTYTEDRTWASTAAAKASMTQVVQQPNQHSLRLCVGQPSPPRRTQSLCGTGDVIQMSAISRSLVRSCPSSRLCWLLLRTGPVRVLHSRHGYVVHVLWVMWAAQISC